MTLKPTAESAAAKIAQLEHQRLTSLINSMADAVIAVDEKMKIVLYNAAALNLLDVNTIRAGEPLSKLLRPVDKDNQPQDITELVKRATVPITSRDLLLPYADNSRINLYLSVAPVHLGYGEAGPRGYVVLLRDISREKSLEEERDEFISVVSHELRTPITIAEGNISNAQYIVNHGGELATVKQALRDAHSQVMFLADMINDLSTLSRAERGTLNVQLTPINVHDLVTDLVNSHRPEATAKGLKLDTRLDPQLELLHSSKLYVREILQNFITNAIKYTVKGHISLQATADPHGVRFTVEDTGIGISRSDQARIFDKFFRSEDYRTRQASGTGLGLYVTEKLARLIRAEITLHSTLNEGSTFTIFVPHLD